MNKRIVFGMVAFLFFSISISAVTPKDTSGTAIIDKIKINSEDIPEGFIYGQIPTFAKTTLLDNPWLMNRAAVNKLTKKLYPNGDANSVKNMYVSIMAKKERPFSSDIICYIIEYNDPVSAKKEIGKLTEFSNFNRDRTIVIPHQKIAVFLITEDVGNFQHIRVLQDKVESRLNSL